MIKINWKILPVILLISLIIFWWSLILNYVYAQQKVYTDRLEKVQQELEVEKNKKTEVEVLEDNIRNNNILASNKLKETEEYKQKAKEANDEYEIYVLIWRCLTEQLALKVNWKDYNVKQCEDTNFIEIYRKK